MLARCSEADTIRGEWYKAAGTITDPMPLALVFVEKSRASLRYQKWYTELYIHVRNCDQCKRILVELTSLARQAEMPEVEE